MIINGTNFDFKLTCLKIEMHLKIERKFREEEQLRQYNERTAMLDRLIESACNSMYYSSFIY